MRLIATLPKHRGNLVSAVWNRLAELEAGGTDIGVISALRVLLLEHQPPLFGHCPRCPRRGLRRQQFPCVVWHLVHLQFFGTFAATEATK